MKATLAAGAISLPFVVYAVRSLLRGHYLTVLAASSMAACVAILVSALFLVHAGRTTLRARGEATGTVFFTDRRFTALMTVGLSFGVMAFLVLAIFAPRGSVDIPMSGGVQIFSPILAWFGAAVGIGGLFSMWRHGGVGYVKISPAGIDIANAVFTEAVRWDDVAAVRDSAETRKTRRAVVLELQDGSEKVIDGADFYVPEGTAFYWMVRHYWRHPSDRRELVDGRALERLEHARFETL